MQYEIVELTELSGRMAHIYSVAAMNEDDTLFDKFVIENQANLKDIRRMIARLRAMAKSTGCAIEFFKENEGAPGDGVVALRQGRMRLYCLRLGNTCIFIGSGGYKPPGIAAYQEDPHLNSRNLLTRKMASAINKAIAERDLIIHDDGTIETTEFLDLEL